MGFTSNAKVRVMQGLVGKYELAFVDASGKELDHSRLGVDLVREGEGLVNSDLVKGTAEENWGLLTGFILYASGQAMFTGDLAEPVSVVKDTEVAIPPRYIQVRFPGVEKKAARE